ncbi:DUF308 domain-containing protein [Candidatus Bathyarchaeota archaeon]|nr:DUF308 domain-containing protein [Candidatus Bathyarchaeota archaeon]
MDNILDPNEEILWRGAPEKKKPASKGLSGVFIAIFPLLWGLIFAYMGIHFLGIILISVGIVLIIYYYGWRSKYSQQIEYMITNQRLLIKSGKAKEDVWFTKLDKICDVIVKNGDLFPITATYPYEPKRYSVTEAMYNSKKVYNIAERKYDEITEIDLYRNNQTRPKLEGLAEPYAIQKLLKEAIFGAGTNYVTCKYCKFRYDLNKEEKCPYCGEIQT